MPDKNLMDPNGKTYIGYRRSSSYWPAYAIYYYLLGKGRLVFKDLQEVTPQRRKAVEDLILSSTHYFLILDPITFRIDRFRYKEDSLLWEIELAIQQERNIIQLWFVDFNLKKDTPDVPQPVVDFLSAAPSWRIDNPHDTAITPTLDQINQTALIQSNIQETSIPKTTANQVLTDAANQTLAALSVKARGQEKTIEALLADEDFLHTGRFLGYSIEAVADWLEYNYKPEV